MKYVLGANLRNWVVPSLSVNCVILWIPNVYAFVESIETPRKFVKKRGGRELEKFYSKSRVVQEKNCFSLSSSEFNVLHRNLNFVAYIFS